MSEKTIHIRSARPDDASIIADFNICMAMETEKLALDPSTIFAGVRAILADAGSRRDETIKIEPARCIVI